jgi:hypothetical protein
VWKEQQEYKKRDTANPEQAQGIWEIKNGLLSFVSHVFNRVAVGWRARQNSKIIGV